MQSQKHYQVSDSQEQKKTSVLDVDDDKKK